MAFLTPRWLLSFLFAKIPPLSPIVGSLTCAKMTHISTISFNSLWRCGGWDLGIAPRDQCAGVVNCQLTPPWQLRPTNPTAYLREFHSLWILFFFVFFFFSFKLTLLGYAIAYQFRELRAYRHTNPVILSRCEETPHAQCRAGYFVPFERTVE